MKIISSIAIFVLAARDFGDKVCRLPYDLCAGFAELEA